MSADSFTFLHAADLHIDSPLVGLARYEGAPVEALRAATRQAFENVVTLAIERRVGFVVLAGDVFDGDWVDFRSGLWFLAQLRRMTSADIPVYLVRGNHDAASRVTKDLPLPAGVVRFAESKPETQRVPGLEAAVHGQGYADASVTQNLARGYPDPVEGVVNIGVLHTSLDGREPHAPYAPCSLDDLRSRGYDYWALGHVHTREVVAEEPWVVFSGCIQGRHARETGPKGATLVHVADGRVERVEHVDCDVARWISTTVDLANLESDDPARFVARLDQALGKSLAAAGDRLLLTRVTLQGRTALDGELRANADRTRATVQDRANALAGEAFVEKVVIATSAPDEGGANEGLGALAMQLARTELNGDERAAVGLELERLEGRLRAASPAAADACTADGVERSVDGARRYLASLLSQTSVDPEETP